MLDLGPFTAPTPQATSFPAHVFTEPTPSLPLLLFHTTNHCGARVVVTQSDRHGRSAEARHGDLPPLQPPDQSLGRTNLVPPLSTHVAVSPTRVRVIEGPPAWSCGWWCCHPAGRRRCSPSTRLSQCPAHHHYFRACTASNRLCHISRPCLTSRGRTRACDPAGRKVSRKPLNWRANTQQQQCLI